VKNFFWGSRRIAERVSFRCLTVFIAPVLAAVGLSSCSSVGRSNRIDRLQETAGLIEDVKQFGKTLGIVPTDALRTTAGRGPVLAMLWLWMQREGTLAVDAPLDIRLAIGYTAEKERMRIEQVYRVERYSVYYRQGNEFADPRSVATIGFAEEPLVRRVKVILHEDLHGDVNFALPWEIEEGIATALGSLATVEYFRSKGDSGLVRSASASFEEERQTARELNALAAEAARIFAGEKIIEAAKEKILAALPNFPVYEKHFKRQIEGQHAPTALEAKLSHDLAYYRYFDAIGRLAEIAPDLRTLIADLKTIAANATVAGAEAFLRVLENRYSAIHH
jgi:hypothetical protein